MPDSPSVSEIDFSGLLLVAAVAFSAPLLLGLAPGLRLPAVVLEIVAGIAIGPAGLGWVELDQPIEVLSLVGLAFLLFLSGLEIDFERLRGRKVAVTGLGFAVSFGIALLAGLALAAAGQVGTPLLVAIILVATSLGTRKARREASRPGARAVLDKPFETPDLLRLIEDVIVDLDPGRGT